MRCKVSSWYFSAKEKAKQYKDELISKTFYRFGYHLKCPDYHIAFELYSRNIHRKMYKISRTSKVVKNTKFQCHLRASRGLNVESLCD